MSWKSRKPQWGSDKFGWRHAPSFLLRTTASIGFDLHIFYIGGGTPSWNLGDGTILTGTTITHDYANTSEKSVKLYVDDFSKVKTLEVYADSITELDVSSLTALGTLSCYDNAELDSIDASLLTSLVTFWGWQCNLSILELPSTTTLLYVYCYNNILTTLDVSTLTAMTKLWCDYNNLTTLDLSSTTALIDLYCNNNSMNSATVDTILSDIDAYGTSNGFVDISANAIPGATGLTAKTNLEARGWTVSVDS